MSEDLFVPLSDGRKVWLTEISRATFEGQNLGMAFESDGGLFIAIEDARDLKVLCKVSDESAGLQLLQLIQPGVAPRPNPHLHLVGGSRE